MKKQGLNPAFSFLVTTQVSHSLCRLACYKSLKFGRDGTFARSAYVGKASLHCTLTAPIAHG